APAHSAPAARRCDATGRTPHHRRGAGWRSPQRRVACEPYQPAVRGHPHVGWIDRYVAHGRRHVERHGESAERGAPDVPKAEAVGPRDPDRPPGARRPRPPAVPTQTLSRTATRLRTGVSLQTLTTDPSSLTTNSPRTLPTHTPSGAGASAAAPSSANSLILEPGASTRTTPR